MIVIHPKDKTTSFLTKIYSEWENVTLIDETWSSRDIREAIGCAPKNEIILMLGHGYSGGLLAPFNGNCFGREIVNEKLVYLLKDRLCIGIWCHAKEFAEKYKLKGIFSGMIVSSQEEANDYHIDIDGEDIDLNNEQFASDLLYCLTHTTMDGVPGLMVEMQDYHSELKDFNYHNIFYYD